MKRKETELLLKASLESEKKERQRIAADLHDGVSGDLNAIRNYLAILHKGEIDVERQGLFAEIKNGVEAALENTRLVSYNLMPPLIESSGFIAALEDYFERLNKKTSSVFKVSNSCPGFIISSAISYELFRVVQEFTTNMIKYGAITQCDILLSLKEDNVCLDIIDNGKKFDFKSLSIDAKGTGIKNINSRIKSINARLVQHEIENGNHFLITIKKEAC